MSIVWVQLGKAKIINIGETMIKMQFIQKQTNNNLLLCPQMLTC